MRRVWITFYLLILFQFPSLRGDIRVHLPPTITLRVQPEDAVFGRPVKVQVTVISSQDQKFASDAFSLNSIPVKLQLLLEEKKAPEGLFSADDPDALVVRTYALSLGLLPEGIQTVGPLVLQLNGLNIESNTISFQVEGAKVSDRFQLFLKIRPEGTYYPGQEVLFEYQILFYDPIQLTHEELPLFSVDWAQLIGTPEITLQTQGSATIQRIQQKAYLQNEGTFEIQPSTIEGFVQRKDPLGNIQLLPPLLRAQTPALDVTIVPFPERGKPADFFGAVGNFTLRGRVPDTKIEIGKPFVVEITASGQGEYQTLHLPSFQNDPNFSGRFLVRERSAGELKDSTKQFLLELTPLTYVSEVPPISFSSFDPSTARYLPVKLQAIPIKMEIPQEDILLVAPEGEETLPALLPGPYDTRDIHALLVLITPIICGLILFLAWNLKPKQPKVNLLPQQTAYQLMLEGIKKRKSVEKSLPIIKRALLQELHEAGLLGEASYSPETLSQEGVIGEVKGVIRRIDERLYTVKASTSQANMSRKDDATLYNDATNLFHKIHKGKF